VVNRAVALAATGTSYFPIADGATYIDLLPGAGFAFAILPGARDGVSLALVARAYYGGADGVAADATVILAPFGLSIRALSSSSRMIPFIGASGGVAVLSAENPVLGRFTKLIPYAGAEIGVQFELFGGAGIELAVGFDAYVEGSVLFLGFSPQAGLFLRL
jgi:hypothetical protein